MRLPFLCVLAAAIAFGESPSLYTRTTYVMGTVATVKLYAPDESSAARDAVAVFSELRRLDDTFTNYRASELTRINRGAAMAPVSLSPEMFEMLRLSIEYSRKYEGAFDVTIGPLVRAWGFLEGPFRVPGRSERERLRRLTGMDVIELDPDRRTVFFRRPGVELDFGGIAKGYAAEKAALLLAHVGVERALVNLGDSSFYALGPPPGRANWPVAVIDPRPPHGAVRIVGLPPFHALSTSGTYGRCFRQGGKLYTHLFDPKAGEPVSVEASATVIAPSGAESEAATKAILLWPPQRRQALKGLEWLRLEACRAGLRSDSSGLPDPGAW